MSYVTQKYALNMIPSGAPVRVPVSQYDAGSRTISFDLYAGAERFSAPSGATAQINGTKPDGKSFSYEVSISGNSVSATITEQMTAAAGRVNCEIAILNGSKFLGSANFVLLVEKGALPEDADMSETDLSTIQKALTNMEESTSAAAASATAAAASESNAKASAEAAAKSATKAATSERHACDYETQASNSATAAATSEANAKASASTAASSASAAATSATNAATSEANAKSSADAAANSASSAATSEANAKNCDASAAKHETSAANYADAAEASATNAATSESNAKSSASAAATSASAAATSATNAATSETNAKASAEAAAASATEAAENATAAYFDATYDSSQNFSLTLGDGATFEALTAAYNAGKACYLRVVGTDVAGLWIIPLVNINKLFAAFERSQIGGVQDDEPYALLALWSNSDLATLGRTAMKTDWENVKNKPFTSIGDGLTVTDGVLSAAGASTWDALTGKPFESVGDGLTVNSGSLKVSDDVVTKVWLDDNIIGYIEPAFAKFATTTINSSADDYHAPTAKAVYNYVQSALTVDSEEAAT